jgi:hypothetical protein
MLAFNGARADQPINHFALFSQAIADGDVAISLSQQVDGSRGS